MYSVTSFPSPFAIMGRGRRMSALATALLALAAMLLSACNGGQTNGGSNRIELSGKAQGTFYSVIYYDSLQRNLQPAIDSLLDNFALTASLWVDNSLLRRVNDNRDSVVNDLFATLLRHSVEMNAYTEGCFDCTVGKLVNAWGFGFANRADITDALIDSLRHFCGVQPELVQRDDGSLVVRKASPETAIDFNAIAQGYATDRVCQFLEQQGISRYLVDIGGEVYVRGCKPDGQNWVVGVERPSENKYANPVVETRIKLLDQSVVTSGNYRKYYEKDGARYSHTIDPRTGRPVTHTLLSVSVVDSCAWRADALATAFMVMGLDRARSFIASHPDDNGAQTVCFIFNENGENKIFMTDRFKSLLYQPED